jgi:hypothetical protein
MKDYLENASHISLSMPSSSGTYLNGCLQPQHRYVSICIETKEREELVRCSMSLDQFAHFLVSNSTSTCTLERYRDKDGKVKAEEVKPPESVMRRMTDKFGTVQEELVARMKDIEGELYDLLNGDKPKTKKAMEQLHHEMQLLRQHFKSNQAYMVECAQEETEQVQENSKAQLSIFLSELGIEKKTAGDIVNKITAQPEDIKLLTAGEAKPVETGYVAKPRHEKLVKDMTALQVADSMHTVLKAIEDNDGINLYKDADGKVQRHLYCASAFTVAQGKVGIRYFSFHSISKLTLDEAKEYLIFLKDVAVGKTEFNTNYHFKGEIERESKNEN